MFKTLVTRGKSGGFFVFMVPVAEELDLKKAARACGEKAVEMLPQKELLPRTGYVHGGCSPIGMKKQFPTYIHQTAADYDTIFFSAGRVGAQVELPLSALQPCHLHAVHGRIIIGIVVIGQLFAVQHPHYIGFQFLFCHLLSLS